jgi:integrase
MDGVPDRLESVAAHRLIARESAAAAPQSLRLLDRVRATVRARHYSRRTEKSYVAWIRRFILYHGKRHPLGMGAAEVTQYLSSLATERNVAASTQNQALSARLFLYRDVVGQDIPWLDDVVRARRSVRLPVVLTRDEVRAVIRHLRGTPRVMAILMHGSGLRLLECARLRVKDIDFAGNPLPPSRRARLSWFENHPVLANLGGRACSSESQRSPIC